MTDKIQRMSIVLNYLSMGGTLTWMGLGDIRMVEPRYGGIRLELNVDGTWHGMDFTLTTFSLWCSEMSDEEIAIIVANNVLNKMKL